MSIRDDVPGGVPEGSLLAMAAGLERMDSSKVDVVVTADFVNAVQHITGDSDYHDDRNGGQVAARTLSTAGGGSVVVANWEVLTDLTEAEIQRVFAHEAGHASIDSRDESPWDYVGARFPDHWWNFQIAYAAAVAIDEFRCEAAVYAAGYPTGPGLSDKDVADDLFSLNLQLIGAYADYQSHQDVLRLREDVLKTVILHLRYMGKVAARYLHGVPVDRSVMNRFARANWTALLEPSWSRFLEVYRNVPDALAPWQGTAPTDAAVALVDLVPSLMASLGYEATEDSFWVHMSARERQLRVDRVNGEAELPDLP